jgi:leader peptidase (prepilin peptidase) / N-methyltransferase
MIIYTILFGTIIGSFLNVCIFRVPEGRSIIMPGSFCPHCSSKIRFYDNIPIISYILLLGRCRRCGRSISPIYPIVEILTALFASILYLKYGLSFTSILLFFLICALIVISFIDFNHYIIPDSISISGIIVGFITSFIPGSLTTPVESISGILLGGGLLLLIGSIYEKLTSREGIGGGDVKLLAMLGAFLGYKSIFLIILISSVLGSVAGIIFLLLSKNKSRYSAIPFGPFLAVAALVVIFLGEVIINFYQSMFYV